MAVLGLSRDQDESQYAGGPSAKASVSSRLGLPGRYIKIFVLVVGIIPVVLLLSMIFNLTVSEPDDSITEI